jgi:putative endonuclease
MGYLYILRSDKNGRYYVGSTNNISRRLNEHNAGHTKSLKNILPMSLVFSKQYDTLLEARQIELHIKKLKSRKIIEKIIRDNNIQTGR